MTGGSSPTIRAEAPAPLADKSHFGMPIRMSEMLATLEANFVERVSVHPVQHRKAKSAIKKAFVNQISGEGFSMVEVLSTCPTNWKMTPIRALEWLEDNMIPYYP